MRPPDFGSRVAGIGEPRCASAGAPASLGYQAMTSSLIAIEFPSIYKRQGQRVFLPKRMAHCTADTKTALGALAMAVAAEQGTLYLSDLFRSYDMQFQAHMDFVAGRKSAFSPPPGGSLHEAGRAFDLSLGDLKMTLAAFWKLAKPLGVVPIISKPNSKEDEAWHFECRGSHQLVYDYYAAGQGSNFSKPYKAMAASAIVSVGVRHDQFGDDQAAAFLQSGLIRLGEVIGNLDGKIGPKSRGALTRLGLDGDDLPGAAKGIDLLLQEKFPEEYFDRTAPLGDLER